jgi:hypothetical protein
MLLILFSVYQSHNDLELLLTLLELCLNHFEIAELDHLEEFSGAWPFIGGGGKYLKPPSLIISDAKLLYLGSDPPNCILKHHSRTFQFLFLFGQSIGINVFQDWKLKQDLLYPWLQSHFASHLCV